nr:hypothetical protein [uncultured Marinobacter sp.]
MSDKIKKIPDTVEAWEDGTLGEDEQFAAVAEPIDESTLNDAAGLQMISIRLQKSLIEDFKNIAEINGIGYQPLIRQVLKRFADAEKKQILRERSAEVRRREEGETTCDPDDGHRDVAVG